MSVLLLDTDTCVELLRGNEAVVARAREHSPADLAVSVLTRYELLYGVACCRPERREQEREKVGCLLGALGEVPFIAATAQQAAGLRAQLTRKGEPIGVIDILIAASALEVGLTLVTHNLSEFSRVPNLRCLSWQA